MQPKVVDNPKSSTCYYNGGPQFTTWDKFLEVILKTIHPFKLQNSQILEVEK